MLKTDSNPESDLFYQLLTRYVRQVGVSYESAKTVQEAVKKLEKDLQLPARLSTKLA